MLEFARGQWLWLFLLVGVFYVAWWFARRYRKQRVTYGLIWQRVAKRVLPPGWKRILRTVLTLLVSGLMLTAIVLKAAGLQRPAIEQPAPLLVFIVLETSPAMRAIEGDQTRRQLTTERAQQIVNSLGAKDRAALAWRQNGNLLLGPWLKTGDVISEPPPTDWLAATGDLDFSRTPAPPDMVPGPPPVRLAIELGCKPAATETAPAYSDRLGTRTDWKLLYGVPTLTESVGKTRSNDGIRAAEFSRPVPGDGTAGSIRFATLGSGKFSARDLTTNKPLNIEPEPDDKAYFRVLLPIQPEPLKISIANASPDALAEDDSITSYLDPARLATVALCYPAADGEPNDQLVKTLRMLLPGREVQARAVPGDDPFESDLLVCDRVLPATYKARYLMCFGVLPAEYGRVGAPVGAEPNMQLRVDQPTELGFEVPDLTLLSAREAVPLEPDNTLTPIAKHIDGGTLVGLQRGATELLYVGFIPHKSTLLLLDDWSGVLLLSRWLSAVQGSNREQIPLFVNAARQAEFQLERAGTLQIRLSPDNPWQPSFGPREYTVTSGADGRGMLGPFVIPGEYTVSRDGREIGRLTAFASYDGDLTVTPTARIDLPALIAPDTNPDWRDHLPFALLWIALALMLLEWLLWLLGVTE